MDEQVDAVQNTVESLWSAEQIASIQTIACSWPSFFVLYPFPLSSFPCCSKRCGFSLYYLSTAYGGDGSRHHDN